MISIENDAHGIEKFSAKNSSKLNKFLHSEVNQLIQHIIVQDQDGQNNNTYLFTKCQRNLLLSLKMPRYYTGICIHVIDKE